MELTSPKSIRNKYIKTLAEDSKYNDILSLLLNKEENEPIYTYKTLNYEEAPDYDNEQRELLEVSMDLNSINNGLYEIKNKIIEFINKTNIDIQDISTTINEEIGRINDINMICGQDSEYNMVIPIYATDFPDCNFENINNKYFGAALTSQSIIPYTITSISGNGIEGNKFVYNNDKFENENPSTDYSNKSYINDENDATKYEYSRLFTIDKSETVDNLINYDTKDVEMVITIASNNSSFNKLQWISENKDLVIKKIETSEDGITFTNQLSREIDNSNKEIVYNDNTYIYGSNILCFPYCNYVRLTMSSNYIEKDTIAIKENEDIIIYPNTRRKKIALNNIKLFNSNYSKTVLISKDLMTGGSVDKASLFLSEYIPDHFKGTEYIKYYLIINGSEEEVIPVNSGKNGIKLIKYSEENNLDIKNHIKTINETIKSVKIKIVIDEKDSKETPYIGNLKLCLGKDTASIYV